MPTKCPHPFGLPVPMMGIRRVYASNRQRTIHYAFTIVFDILEPQFIDYLAAALNTTDYVTSVQTMARPTYSHVFFK